MESTQSSQQHQQQAKEILNALLGDDMKKEVPESSGPRKGATEVRQLFIGNLPYRVRWQDIKDLFRKAGNVVRADVALSFETNRSKGHGIVLFTCIDDAQKAIDMFNGYRWQGRILEVRYDRGFVNKEPVLEKEKLISQLSSPAVEIIEEEHNEKSAAEDVKMETKIKEKRTEKKQQDVKDVDDDCKQLFVGNLPFHCQWQDLRELFKTCGKIVRADVVLNFEGRSRGFGTVLFNSHKDAKNAIEQYNGYEFHNRILRVHFDKFAATHQRLREYEAETYGQRQIQDPASVELLRQIYLPTIPQIPMLVQQQEHQHQSLQSMGFYEQMPVSNTYNTATTINNSYPYTNTQYNNGYSTYQQQPWIQPSSRYQVSPYPLHQPPPLTRNDFLSSLPTTFNNLNLNQTHLLIHHDSAGLNHSNNNTNWNSNR